MKQLYKPAQLSIQPAQQEDPKRGFAEMNKALSDLMNARIQMENYEWQQKQRGLAEEERININKQNELMYGKLFDTFGDSHAQAITAYKDMNLRPDLAESMLQMEAFKSFMEETNGQFNLEKIEQYSERLSGDQIKQLMSMATDSPEIRYGQAITSISERLGKDIKTHDQFVKEAVSMGLNPKTDGWIWNEYQQERNRSLSLQASQGQVVKPDINPSSITADANFVLGMFDRAGLNPLDLNRLSAHDLQRSFKEMQSFKQDLDNTRKLIDPSITSKYMDTTTNRLGLSIGDKNTRFTFNKKGKVDVYKKHKDGWLKIKDKKLNEKERTDKQKIENAGYDRIYEYDQAKRVYWDRIKNEHTRVSNLVNSAMNIRALYGDEASDG